MISGQYANINEPIPIMNRKSIYILVLAAFFIASAGLIFIAPSGSILSTMSVKIEKDKDTGIWRVRDKKGRNKGTMNVNKKDKIEWLAKGSDMVFTFSEPVQTYFEVEEGQFNDGVSQKVGRDKKLKLTVKASAPSDTLIYQVYVVAADTFVVGNSPPKIIIK